jgi:hypothetical protein
LGEKWLPIPKQWLIFWKKFSPNLSSILFVANDVMAMLKFEK